jgi:hypothetical protein
MSTETSTLRQRLIRAGAIALVAAALLVVYLATVHATGLMPQCVFKQITGGLSCPGCGSQRAFMALLHGHIVDAAMHNLLLPPTCLYLLMLLGGYLLPGRIANTRLYRHATSARAMWVITAVIIGWTIMRNLLHI